ncbi:MAG: hypothetical protein HY704_04145 [Gemmatimonadetes bacterium]|nr:hypothetical protein [Gemmatimonadota bacterium]
MASRHWSYEVLEFLEALGAVAPGTSTLRPLPLGDVRRLLDAAARDTALESAARALARAALLRYDEEFVPRPGLAAGGRLRGALRGTGGDAVGAEGVVGELAFRVQGGPAGAFALLEHEWGAGAERPRLRRGGVGGRMGGVWLYGGREAFRMDGGGGGGLVLNDEAQLDGLLLATPASFRVPGAGETQVQLGLFRLFRYEAVDDPWFITFRITARPASWLQVAVNRAVLFGGRFKGGRVPYDPKIYGPDSTSLGAADILGVLLGRNTTRDDQKASIEARISLDALELPALVYGELAFEDPDRSFGDPAILAGLLAVIRDRPTLALRYEYAAIGRAARICSWCDTLPAYWYWHRRFQSGYVVEGRLLGHPLGGYGLQHLLELRYLGPDARLRVEARATLSRRDRWNLLEKQQPGRAKGGALEADYRPWHAVEVHLSASTERGRAGWRESRFALAAAVFF